MPPDDPCSRRPPLLLLQVCPNDHPPFRDICSTYAVAARGLGWDVLTVFLGPARGRPLEGARYLDLTPAELRRVSRLGAALRFALGESGAGMPLVALCHRYRAWRGFLASGIRARLTVAIAHEFGFFARRQRRVAQALRRRLRRPVTRFAGVSDAVREELRRVVPDPLVLPNALDLAAFDAALLDRAQARQALGVPDDAFVIGVVGRLHRKKSPQLALEGFRVGLPDMPGAHLVFLGEGELRASLERDARLLPVSFAGFVPDAFRCFAGLDLLLLPSSDAEAFGMVALEAMAAGLPVLSSAAPGPRFVLGASGDYFQPAVPEALAGALRRAFDDWRAGALSARADAARRRVEAEFSVPALSRRLRALVEAP
jgi:glycosyltransferase involved in cell wall biosynthesis